jgi:NAD-dependent dihydropyrimidine dehydrogenase PreA subunit
VSGLFIDVEISPDSREDAELAKKLEEVCPVDIFSAKNGHAEVVEANLDECVLCELCVNAAPPGALRVVKLYDGTSLER